MDTLMLTNIVGILASVLGLTLAIYGILVSGPQLGQMIKEMHADTERTLERIADTQRHIADLIVHEGERTRAEVRTRR
jgi:hypothetical protein